MEKHCVSLELAKQMKEAGWKKKTEFWWIFPSGSHKGFELVNFRPLSSEHYPAPLATEILEELPLGIAIKKYNCDALAKMWLYLKKYNAVGGLGYEVIFPYKSNPEISGGFCELLFCDALAKMWLYLKKGEPTMTNKLTLWDIVKTRVPRALKQLESDKRGFSWEYKLGHNDCLSDLQQSLSKVEIREEEIFNLIHNKPYPHGDINVDKKSAHAILVFLAGLGEEK